MGASPHSLDPERITLSDLQVDHFSEETIAAKTYFSFVFAQMRGVDESNA